MEKKLEIIRNQYSLFDCVEVGSEDQVLEFIVDSCLEEATYYRDLLKKEKKANNRDKRISTALGNYASRYGYLSPESYECDNAYLSLKQVVLEGYMDMLSLALRDTENDNFHDMNLLVRFARSKYLANNASIDELRKCRELEIKGIHIDRVLPDEDSEAMEEFFREELSAVVTGKGSARVKK